MEKLIKKRMNDGITLIILIITIILMLILLAVVVNVIVDGKLLKTAQYAVNRTNIKIQNEQKEIDELMNQLNNYVNNKNYVVEVNNEYNNAMKLICIYTDETNTAYKYNDIIMYDITDSGYMYQGRNYQKIFGTVITGEFNNEYITEFERTEEVENLIYDMDIDDDGEINYLDVMFVGDLMGNIIEGSINQYLKADVDRNKKIEINDQEIIMNSLL